MNKPLLTILWMLLLTLPVFAETSLPSKTKPDVESNSSSSPKIDWPSALPMMTPDEANALGTIVDEQVERAFEEGYKAAELRFEPELEERKAKAQSEVARFWDGFGWGCGVGVAASIGLTVGGIILYGAVSR